MITAKESTKFILGQEMVNLAPTITTVRDSSSVVYNNDINRLSAYTDTITSTAASDMVNIVNMSLIEYDLQGRVISYDDVTEEKNKAHTEKYHIYRNTIRTEITYDQTNRINTYTETVDADMNHASLNPSPNLVVWTKVSYTKYDTYGRAREQESEVKEYNADYPIIGKVLLGHGRTITRYNTSYNDTGLVNNFVELTRDDNAKPALETSWRNVSGIVYNFNGQISSYTETVVESSFKEVNFKPVSDLNTIAINIRQNTNYYSDTGFVSGYEETIQNPNSVISASLKRSNIQYDAVGLSNSFVDIRKEIGPDNYLHEVRTNRENTIYNNLGQTLFNLDTITYDSAKNASSVIDGASYIFSNYTETIKTYHTSANITLAATLSNKNDYSGYDFWGREQEVQTKTNKTFNRKSASDTAGHNLYYESDSRRDHITYNDLGQVIYYHEKGHNEYLASTDGIPTPGLNISSNGYESALGGGKFYDGTWGAWPEVTYTVDHPHTHLTGDDNYTYTYTKPATLQYDSYGRMIYSFTYSLDSGGRWSIRFTDNYNYNFNGKPNSQSDVASSYREETVSPDDDNYAIQNIGTHNIIYGSSGSYKDSVRYTTTERGIKYIEYAYNSWGREYYNVEKAGWIEFLEDAGPVIQFGGLVAGGAAYAAYQASAGVAVATAIAAMTSAIINQTYSYYLTGSFDWKALLIEVVISMAMQGLIKGTNLDKYVESPSERFTRINAEIGGSGIGFVKSMANYVISSYVENFVMKQLLDRFGGKKSFGAKVAATVLTAVAMNQLSSMLGNMFNMQSGGANPENKLHRPLTLGYLAIKVGFAAGITYLNMSAERHMQYKNGGRTPVQTWSYALRSAASQIVSVYETKWTNIYIAINNGLQSMTTDDREKRNIPGWAEFKREINERDTNKSITTYFETVKDFIYQTGKSMRIDNEGNVIDFRLPLSDMKTFLETKEGRGLLDRINNGLEPGIVPITIDSFIGRPNEMISVDLQKGLIASLGNIKLRLELKNPFIAGASQEAILPLGIIGGGVFETGWGKIEAGGKNIVARVVMISGVLTAVVFEDNDKGLLDTKLTVVITQEQYNVYISTGVFPVFQDGRKITNIDGRVRIVNVTADDLNKQGTEAIKTALNKAGIENLGAEGAIVLFKPDSPILIYVGLLGNDLTEGSEAEALKAAGLSILTIEFNLATKNVKILVPSSLSSSQQTALENLINSNERVKGLFAPFKIGADAKVADDGLIFNLSTPEDRKAVENWLPSLAKGDDVDYTGIKISSDADSSLQVFAYVSPDKLSEPQVGISAGEEKIKAVLIPGKGWAPVELTMPLKLNEVITLIPDGYKFKPSLKSLPDSSTVKFIAGEKGLLAIISFDKNHAGELLSAGDINAIGSLEGL
ncbi:MAG: hypothetical protein COZ98_04115, partial [Candidatus Omnitrophica bacterium CG_4_8_14_3_um_filter_43_15]